MAFATWAPKTFGYYAHHLHDLLLHDTSLVLNWVNSIFAAATFNFGPRTLCFWHTDSRNLPFGWCAITALGQFDVHWGGHLVLWDLKLVIDFLQGSTILILSAILRHSNIFISKGERHYSFTQYTVGGVVSLSRLWFLDQWGVLGVIARGGSYAGEERALRTVDDGAEYVLHTWGIMPVVIVCIPAMQYFLIHTTLCDTPSILCDG